MLAALYKRGFTGRLEVNAADTSTIFFRKGRVVKAQRPDQLDTLEQVLTQERLVSPSAPVTPASAPGRRSRRCAVRGSATTTSPAISACRCSTA